MTTIAPNAPLPASQDRPWYGLSGDEACQALAVDPTVGLTEAEVTKRRAQYGSNKLAEVAKEPTWKAFLRQYRDLMQLVLVGAALVSIIAIQDISTGLVVLAITVFNAAARPAPGGQGGRERRRAAPDADHLGQRAPRRRALPGAGRGARPGRHRRVRGRGQGAGRRTAPRRRDPRDRGVGADRGEHPVVQGDRRDRRRGRRPRGPPRHGVHELAGDPWPRRDGRHVDGHVDRGRPHLQHVERCRAGEDPAHPPARPADRADHDHGGRSPSALIIILGLIRGDDFDELFIVGISLAISAIPTGLPGRRHDAAVVRHPRARGGGGHRQAAPVGRDARVDVGDLLGQDRHARRSTR